jgi:hypothetical protein
MKALVGRKLNKIATHFDIYFVIGNSRESDLSEEQKN